MTLTVWSQI